MYYMTYEMNILYGCTEFKPQFLHKNKIHVTPLKFALDLIMHRAGFRNIILHREFV